MGRSVQALSETAGNLSWKGKPDERTVEAEYLHPDSREHGERVHFGSAEVGKTRGRTRSHARDNTVSHFARIDGLKPKVGGEQGSGQAPAWLRKRSMSGWNCVAGESTIAIPHP